MKYRKKPVVIEAWRIPMNMEHTGLLPPMWLVSALVNGIAVAHGDTGGVSISTSEGVMLGNPGDWIIQGVKGELYPCKPDIFDATYTPETEAK